MDLLTYAITSILTSSLVSVASIFIIKSYFSNIFAKDMESFKSNLSKQVLQENIKYEKLHKERADVIKEVYKKIANVYDDFESLMHPIQNSGEPTIHEKTVTASVSARSLVKYFSENKIFFEKDLADKITNFQKILHITWMEFNNKQYLPLAEQTVKWTEVWETMKGTVPTLQSEIEDHFRQILGITTA